MSSFRVNFTTKTLEAITPPIKGRNYYYDTKEDKLVLDVTAGGSKTFYVYQRINGKPERMKIGKFPVFSVENARKKAQSLKGAIANGKNPQADRRKLRAELTLKELFDQFMDRYSRVHKKSWQYDEREIPKFLLHWFTRKISNIRKDEVRKLHEDIYQKSGLYQANRILERLRTMYNKAIEWGWEGENPTIGIKKYKEKSRDRFIQPDEMQRFIIALEQEENLVARDFFKMALFTGARKTNVLMMRWEDIDFTSEVWRIPETKNGDPLRLPLSAFALKVLKDRRAQCPEDCEWVFPSSGEGGFYNDPKKAWARILERAEIGDLRIHDLRRTLGSYQAAGGANSYIIGSSLGHKSPQSTAIYARLNLDPVRASVELATEAMFKAGKKDA